MVAYVFVGSYLSDYSFDKPGGNLDSPVVVLIPPFVGSKPRPTLTSPPRETTC